MISGYFFDSPDERLISTQLYIEFINPKKVFVKTETHNREGIFTRQYALFMKKDVRFSIAFTQDEQSKDWVVADIDLHYPRTDSPILTQKQEEKLIAILKPIVVAEMKKPDAMLRAMQGELTSLETTKNNRKSDMDHYENQFKESVKKYTDISFKCTLISIKISEFKEANNL